MRVVVVQLTDASEDMTWGPDVMTNAPNILVRLARKGGFEVEQQKGPSRMVNLRVAYSRVHIDNIPGDVPSF